MRRKQPVRLKPYRPDRRGCFDWGRFWLLLAFFTLLIILAFLLAFLVAEETPLELIKNIWPSGAPLSPVEFTPVA